MPPLDELDLPTADAEFTGTPRFELRRRLGEGSFGVVFEAYDTVRHCPVALKWLRYADAEQVFRFKTEFRSLAEISHPNLVQLFDLESDGQRWFFTMERVRGVPLPEYFRPAQLPPGPQTLRARSSKIMARIGRSEGLSTPERGLVRPSRQAELDVDPAEVRGVFRDLAEGVVALHESGKLHRDLKCQNVLVTPDRRVVILDFGMVRELGPPTGPAHDVAGTPLYMAPELISSPHATRAADWYSFGVMLYRALTDELPFDGRMYAVLAMKQSRDAPRASDRVKGVPEDLDELCARLLSRDPETRPSGAEVLEALGGSGRPSRVSYPNLEDPEIFVGRRRELRTLETARRRARGGLATAVLVHGPSGIGKSALIRHFLDRLLESERDVLVLRGRCFERETLPYKALDEAVDQLTARLLALPDEVCAELVPDRVADLTRVFGALMRVPAFADAASPSTEVPDPQERRRRAIEGFEDLLRRLTRRQEVVIAIDDLHWGDRDSAMMIRPMLTDPEAPPVLWLGTYRTDEAEQSPFLEAVQEAQDWDAFLVEVPELSAEAARTLLELRLSGTARDEDLLDELTEEAAGSPLLIDLMVRHVRSGERAPKDLRSALGQHLDDLSEEARALLGVLAVRGRPLARDVAADVLGVRSFDATMVTQLRNAKLLRLREQGDAEELELYHDRIREAVSGAMEPDEEERLHGALADALLARPDAEAESLAHHLRGAGRLAEALRYTLEAARQAEAALAFERAAELIRIAITLRAEAGSAVEQEADERDLWVQLGEALRNAGRGAEAAEAYQRASCLTGPRNALELRRLAAEQYLFSGHFEEGRRLMGGVLEDLGLSMPENQARTIAEFLARRAQVRLRGTRFKERDATSLDAEELLRIDVCWSIAIGFAMVDPLRGGIFQARHMVMALDAGDLGRVARAIAVEVPFSATPGDKNDRRTRSLIRLGRDLAAREGTPYIRGLLASSTGGADWLCGRWAEARRHEERALEVLRSECSGVAWQISTSTVVLLDVLWRMGLWGELFERWPDVLEDAVSRGDLLLDVYVRVKFVTLSHLAAGRPDEAIRESQDALARWSQPSFQLMHFWDLFVRTEAQLYAGRTEAARDRVHAGASAVRRSGLLQLQMYEATWRDLEGRAALGCAQQARGGRRKALLKEARAAAKKLERGGALWARGPCSMLRASIASLEGDDRAAEHELDRAERAFEAADMSLHATVARCVGARLRRDFERHDRELEALAALELAEPARWLEVLAPGSWNR